MGIPQSCVGYSDGTSLHWCTILYLISPKRTLQLAVYNEAEPAESQGIPASYTVYIM